MIEAYLTRLAQRLDKENQLVQADLVDNLVAKYAQTNADFGASMPKAGGPLLDQANNANQEVEKMTAQQTTMLNGIKANLDELKALKNTINRGAKDFWRFRRWKYQQGQVPVNQPQSTNLGQFGLRGAPAPQLRHSQVANQPQQSAAPPARQAPAVQPQASTNNLNMSSDEVEEFFQWLEAEQARKMQNNGMFGGGNMNLPFQIG